MKRLSHPPVLRLLAMLALAGLLGCGRAAPEGLASDSSIRAGVSGQDWQDGMTGAVALLATSFDSLADFKQLVQVAYFGDSTADSAADGAAAVQLRYASNGHTVTSVLAAGVTQDDIMRAKDGGPQEQATLALRAPFSVAYRGDLQRVYTLSRRRPLQFGEGDIAFFDLGKAMVAHLDPHELARRSPRDTSEKGFVNTFNHVTAQAFITSLFSEALADFIGDTHERKNMPTLTTGRFTQAELDNKDNNPVDNYVDLLNNELGQEIGLQLATRYHIDRKTRWTPELLADYLNALQAYYSWTFQIGMRPFRPSDDMVVRFARKLNGVLDMPTP
jgi:hypothetical protein